MKKILVTKAQPIDGKVIRCRCQNGRPGFGLDMFYTLHDGSTYQSRITSERKKDLPKTLENEHAAIRAQAMAVDFNDAGEALAKSTTYGSLAQGMRPEPQRGAVGFMPELVIP